MSDPFSGIESFPILEMDYFGLTENQLNKLPPKQRLEEMIKIIKHSDDESQRWDSICLCGELYHVLDRVDHDLSNVDSLQMKTHIKDLFRWVLKDEIKRALDDPVRDVRETAQFVLKRLRRYKNEAYEGLQII